MLNLPPQAVAPANAPATANPAPPQRHRPPDAPRERFSQALDDAITAEPKTQTQAQPPERARAPTRPAQGSDSARDKRPAPAAHAHPAADKADKAAEADAAPAADEDATAAPDNLGALLAQLRLGPAGAPAAARGTPVPDGPNTAPGATAGGRPAAPGTDRASTGRGVAGAGPGHGVAGASAAHGTDRAGTAPGADRAGAAASPSATAFEDQLASARIAAAEPATRPGDTSAAPAAAWVAANGASTALGGSAPAAGAAPAEATLPAPRGSADFGTQLGAQITTFVREGVEHARLHLNPADMGPVSVQIQLDGTTAVVQLGAEHASTRQALEQAMPTLAASLREAGLTLTGGGVSDQARQGPGGQAAGDGRHGRGDTGPAGPRGLDAASAGASSLPARRGVVDLVA